MKDEIKILKLAGVSFTDILIETGRKAESVMDDIIYLTENFQQLKSKSPHLFKGDKTKEVFYNGISYTVILNNWS